MSRYSGHSGSGTGSGNDDYDDTILKLQKYSAISGLLSRVRMVDSDYGDKLLVGAEELAALDGIVMQRDDSPNTWKVFGFGDMGFNVGEDGLVYQGYDAESEEFVDQMSAEDIYGHARVQGLTETFGGDKYYYTPVGVAIEESQDIVLNDDLDAETTEVDSTRDEGSSTGINVGDTTMFLSNGSWSRTFAKLTTETGDDIVATEIDDDGNEVPVKERYGWLTEDEVDLREELDGRRIELFIIEETTTFDGDDESTTYTTPILLDQKTGERITIDNGVDDDGGDEDADEVEQQAAEAVADGGEPEGNSDSQSEDTSTTATSESPDSDTKSESDDGDGVPEVLDDLIDYFARSQGTVEPDELREIGADEVDDPEAIDWDAAAAEVQARA